MYVNRSLSRPGERAIQRCDLLGAPPFSDDERLLYRPYLTKAHLASLNQIKEWMIAAGMNVRVDSVGNLVGRYEGSEPAAPALLIGSHIDSVYNAGRYDGALGVMLGIECVEAFSRTNIRLPFAIEVIAFGDEEGSRFPSAMLCSRAIAQGLNIDSLELRDKDGTTLRQALSRFGLDPAKIASAQRSPDQIVAYVEAHIEQGPVLEAEDLPIGVVTGIASQLRATAKFTGEAGHAGTMPMRLRHDALAASAQAILAIESICQEGPPDLVGTVGSIQCSSAAFNVIAGQSEISLDLRAGTRTVRDAAMAKIRARLEQIAIARRVELNVTVLQNFPECRFAPELIDAMDYAVGKVGVRPFRLVSGAGHDAMVVANLAPAAMLFIRCERGISHNSSESVNSDDVDIAARALVAFVQKASTDFMQQTRRVAL